MTITTGYIAEMEPVVEVPDGCRVAFQWGQRLLVDGEAEMARLTVSPWTDDMTIRINPRSGIDPEIDEWAASKFWRRIRLANRMRMIQACVASEIAVLRIRLSRNKPSIRPAHTGLHGRMRRTRSPSSDPAQATPLMLSGRPQSPDAKARPIDSKVTDSPPVQPFPIEADYRPPTDSCDLRPAGFLPLLVRAAGPPGQPRRPAERTDRFDETGKVANAHRYKYRESSNC